MVQGPTPLSGRRWAEQGGGAQDQSPYSQFLGAVSSSPPFFRRFFKGCGKETQTQKWKTGRLSSDLGVVILFRGRGFGKRSVSGFLIPPPHSLTSGNSKCGEDVLRLALANRRRSAVAVAARQAVDRGEHPWELGAETRSQFLGGSGIRGF